MIRRVWLRVGLETLENLRWITRDDNPWRNLAADDASSADHRVLSHGRTLQY
jgi:hypothetical protein